MIDVLLVDDHTVLRDGLKSILNDEGDIDVIGAASDGLEAIKKADQLEPEVILMDISMPNLNGIEATRKIVEKHDKTRVIILSMKYSKEDIYQALKAGATGYIVKESASKEVVEAVRAAHENRRYLSSKVDKIVIDSYIQEQQEHTGDNPLELLSTREREILQLVAEGENNRDIAAMLFISEKTVSTYRSRMMSKLGLDNLTELIKFPIKHDIISV